MGLKHVAVTSALTASALASVPVLSGIAHAAPTPVTFGFTGAAQSFTVPPGVCSLSITAVGAGGGEGGGLQVSSAGGAGGSATATVTVVPGEVLTVMVGGQGDDGTAESGGGGGAIT